MLFFLAIVVKFNSITNSCSKYLDFFPNTPNLLISFKLINFSIIPLIILIFISQIIIISDCFNFSNL